GDENSSSTNATGKEIAKGRHKASANELGTNRESVTGTAGKCGEWKMLFSKGKNGLPKWCSRRIAHGAATTVKLTASAAMKPRDSRVFLRQVSGKKSRRTQAERACSELVSFSALAMPNSKPAHTTRGALGTRNACTSSSQPANTISAVVTSVNLEPS